MFSKKFSRTTRTLSAGMPILGAVLLCMMMVNPAQAARAIVTKIALAYGNTTPGGEKLSGSVDEALSGAGYSAVESFNYLDTTSSESFEPKDHTQSIVRTHKLDDGTSRVFISNAENVNNESKQWASPFSKPTGDRGSIMGFKVPASRLDASSGMLKSGSAPFTRELSQSLNNTFAGFPDETHPSSLAWLPDSSGPGSKGGYLFATFEYNGRSMVAYYWNRENPYVLENLREFKFSSDTALPRFVSIIKNKGIYRLMVSDSGHSEFYQALPMELFNGRNRINFEAFRRTNDLNVDNNKLPADSSTPDGSRRAFGQNVYFIQDKDENLFLVGYQNQNELANGKDRAFLHPVTVDNATGSVTVDSVSAIYNYPSPTEGPVAAMIGTSVGGLFGGILGDKYLPGYLVPNCEAGCSHWVSPSGKFELNKVAHYSTLFGTDWQTIIESRHR